MIHPCSAFYPILFLTDTNLGVGHSARHGASGAGHGGTSGRGYAQTYTGQPYGHLYEPTEFGSAGGSSDFTLPNKQIDHHPGGRGGGVIFLNVSDFIRVS